MKTSENEDGFMARRIKHGYAGMSLAQAKEHHRALIDGVSGVRFPRVYDPKERDERISILRDIMLEQSEW